MPGSQTTQGRSDTRADVPSRIAFRATYRVGTPEIITYAAQWLACTLPCRRFTATLADARARLGANVDRYSFTATDSHRLLLAGLPAHKSLIPSRTMQPLPAPKSVPWCRCELVSALNLH